VCAIWRAAAVIASAVVDQLPIERIALGAHGDAVHHRHRVDRIVAGGRFGRQHHCVGAVIDGCRDVRGFGARRRRCVDHRIQHLRRDDHRLAVAAAGADDALLQRRHVLGRHLDAEIAARDHDRVT